MLEKFLKISEKDQKQFDKEFFSIRDKYFKGLDISTYEISTDLDKWVLGRCIATLYGDGNVESKIIFNNRLLRMPTWLLKSTIKHELIHHKNVLEFKNNTRGVLKQLFPHGCSFILDSIRVGNYFDAFFYT